jgi:hypothetical protein
MLCLDELKRLSGPVVREDFESVARELLGEELPARLLVLDDQDRLPRHGAEASTEPSAAPNVLSAENIHGLAFKRNPCKPACRPCRRSRQILCRCGPGVVSERRATDVCPPRSLLPPVATPNPELTTFPRRCSLDS